MLRGQSTHLRPKILVCWHHDFESGEGICLIVLHVLQNGWPAFAFCYLVFSGTILAFALFMSKTIKSLIPWSIVCGMAWHGLLALSAILLSLEASMSLVIEMRTYIYGQCYDFVSQLPIHRFHRERKDWRHLTVR